MLLMFATPLFAGFANVLMPVQIGAPDVAFPRLNAIAYWFYFFGSFIAVAGFFTPQGAASFGWFAYAPLSSTTFSPGLGGDLWVFGLALSGFGTIMGGVNFITTIITMRAPGMTMFRMPIFTWNTLVTSILVIMCFPPLAAALFALGADRKFGAHIFDPANGGPMLWQHLFWFFGHPEVYILALPFFGIVSEIFPVFSRKPVFGYRTLVYATIAIAALSMTVWAHHMYVTGSVLLPFFAFTTMLIAVPTGVKIFNWIGTMWRGSVTFETPMLWSLGFLTTFIFGGLTGVILASPALDFHLSDSYFVVAHFHYVVFGTVVFAMFAGFYFWWPKMTGKMLNERLGKIHFWLLFVGFHVTFLIQHWLGVIGMPRRYATYLETDGFTWMTPDQLEMLSNEERKVVIGNMTSKITVHFDRERKKHRVDVTFSEQVARQLAKPSCHQVCLEGDGKINGNTLAPAALHAESGLVQRAVKKRVGSRTNPAAEHA
jgi:cytochrome c oxidase subunit 1